MRFLGLLFNFFDAIMRCYLSKFSLIFSLLFLVPSGFLSAQGLGARIVYSGLPDDESIFTCFLFRGATYVASAPDDEPRTITLWRVEEFDLVLFRNINIPSRASFSGSTDRPIHLNPKIQLPFFARTERWIYFLDSAGGDLAQLHRTDGVTTEQITHFTGEPTTPGNSSFFDRFYAQHISDQNNPQIREGGPFFIYEQLDSEPDKLYYLTIKKMPNTPATSPSDIQLHSITDSEPRPTLVVEKVATLISNFWEDGLLAFFLTQNLGGNKLFVGNDALPLTRSEPLHDPYLFSGGGTRVSLTYEKPAERAQILGIHPGGGTSGRTLQRIFGRNPNAANGKWDWSVLLPYARLHPHKAVMEVEGTESAVFMLPLSITDGQTALNDRRHTLFYMPLSGADEGKVYDMGTVHEDDPLTPEDDRDDWVFQLGPNASGFGLPHPMKVRHEGKDQVLFVMPDGMTSDANGENLQREVRRSPAVWLSDLTRAGTKRLGHIAMDESLGYKRASQSLFDAHVQVGNTVYLLGRVLGVEVTAIDTFVGEHLTRPLGLYSVDLEAPHIPHTNLPSGNVTAGGVRQVSADSPFLILFNRLVYYRRNGDLYRTSPSTSAELVFDTESGGTIAGGSAVPVVLSGKLYFVARIGGIDSGHWFAYSYDGASTARIAFLGTGADVAPRLLGASAFPGIPSLVANNNIYFLDETAPTFSTTLSLTEAGETNALFSFVPSERASYSWVVTERATAPSSSQLRTAFDDANSDPVAHNLLSDQLSLPDSSEVFEASGLTSGTDYHLHLVLVDGAGNESEVVSVAFTTLGTGGDVVLNLPPVLSSPLCVTRLTHSEVSLTYTPSEASTAYWVLAPFSEPAPSRAQVVSGFRADGMSANSGTQTISSAVSQTLTISSDLASSPSHVIFPSEPGMDTECRVYVVLEDAGGNSSPLYTTYFTTQEDNTRDRILTVEDFDVTLSGTTATATFTARDEDFDGLWWLSLPSNAPPVTRRFIIDGTTFDGLSVPDGHSGSSATGVDEDDTGTFEVTNLEVGRSYTLYFTASTGAGVLSSDGATTSDDYLPVQSHTFSAGAPFLAISGVVVDDASHSASVSFTTSISGDYHWLVQGSSLPFLSGFQIFSGLNANGIRPPTGLVGTAGVVTDVANPNTFSVEELPLSGDYCVYVTIRSSDGILHRPEAALFTHTAASRPSFAPYFSFPTDPSVSSVSFDSAVISFTPTAAGAYCWVLQDSSTPAPTASHIVAGEDGSGTSALSFSPAGISVLGGSAVDINLSSLAEDTAYTLYVLLSNADGTSLRTPVGRSFQTDVFAFSRTPSVGEPAPGTRSVTFQLSHPGRYCWIALPPTSPAPPVATVTNARLRARLQSDATLHGVDEVLVGRQDVRFEVVLPPESDYHLYLAISSPVRSLLAPDALSLTTDPLALHLPGTNRPPLRIDLDPELTDVQTTFQSTYPGAYCWVVLPSSEAAPGVQEVTNSYLRSQIQSNGSLRGKGEVPEEYEDVVFQVRDLVLSTSYNLFLVASYEDAFFTAPERLPFDASPAMFQFSTAPGSVTATARTVVVRGEERYEQGHWLVLPSSAPNPSAAQVFTGGTRGQLQPVSTLRSSVIGQGTANNTGIAFNNTMDVNLVLSGLVSGASYRLHVASEFTSRTAFSGVLRLVRWDFTHDTDPSFTQAPSVSSITDTTAEVSFTPNSAASEYCWVLLDGAASAPDRAQVLRGEDGNGTEAALRSPDGGVTLTGDAAVTFPLSGLTADTAYHIYLVLSNAAGDAFSGVGDAGFMTETASMSPSPSFTQLPSVDSITATAAEVSFTPSSAVRYDWVLLDGAASAPDRAQVLRGEDGNGTEAALRSPDGGVPLTGNAAVTFPLSGLTADTAYHIYLVLSNAAGNAFSGVGFADFMTEAAPLSPSPSFTQSPSAGSITATAAEVSFTPSHADQYYWVLLDGAASAPTRDQVLRGEDSSDMAASFRSPGAVSLTGDVAVTFPLSGLSPGTSYHLYLVLSNTAGTVFSAVGDASFVTVSAPSFSSSPTVSSVAPFSAEVSFTPSSTAHKYCWVLVSGTSPAVPSSFQVRHGQDGNGLLAALRSPDGGLAIPSGGGPVSISLSSLVLGTDYALFIVLANAANDAFSSVSDVVFATPGFSVSISSITPDAATPTTAAVRFRSNVPGSYHWLSVTSGSTAPTQADVRDATLRASFQPLAGLRGTGAIAAAGDVPFSITGLTVGTSYDLFLVVEASGSIFSDLVTDSFTQGTAVVRPSFTATPSVSSVTATAASVSFTPRDAARYDWVVVSGASAGTVPSEDQVRTGLDASGMSAFMSSAAGGVALSGDAAVTFPLSGLSPSTSYYLYLILSNTADTLFSAVEGALFTTVSAPSFGSPGRPWVVSAGPDSADFRFTPQAASRYCWVLLTAASVTASGAPDSYQVRHGQDGSGMLAPHRSAAGGVSITVSVAVGFSVSGLLSETRYQLFMVLANASNDAFSAVASVSATTTPAPAPPPTFTSGPTVAQHSTVRTTAVVTFTPSTIGRYYWVVQPESVANDPTSVQVRNGQDGNGTAVLSGLTNAPSGVDAPASAITFEIPSLEEDTAYTLHLLLVSAAGVEGTVSLNPFTLPGVGFGSLDKGLSIAPNPVSDFLRVTVPVPDTVFEVYSLSGDLLHRGTYSAGTHIFSFSDYAPGVYVLRVSFGTDSFSCRLVKK